MSLVVANGVELHVQRLGTGSPVVMAHGLLLGSLASWYFTAAPALAKRHQVLLYDLRGHGRSERVATGYDLASMTRDLEALIADFGAEPIAVVGHSYGALIALRFALDHPGRVSKLVLVEAPLPPSELTELDAFVDQSPEQMVAALPEQMRAFFDKGSRQARRLLASLTFLVGETSLLADLRAEPDIEDAVLASVDVPVLCVYGDQSKCRSVGERLAEVMQSTTLRLLPGGHYLHLDASAALTELITEFVGG